jgi:hypothetical protein
MDHLPYFLVPGPRGDGHILPICRDMPHFYEIDVSWRLKFALSRFADERRNSRQAGQRPILTGAVSWGHVAEK